MTNILIKANIIKIELRLGFKAEYSQFCKDVRIITPQTDRYDYGSVHTELCRRFHG